jgi:NADPH-dependent 2,4-dienoyl-CoA reductase/sulfur reductase-like enzyme
MAIVHATRKPRPCRATLFSSNAEGRHVRIVVIGGVAAGMSAASQAKRRMPGAEVIALERTRDVSYGACGIPYNLADPARDLDDLVVIHAERFRAERAIDLRIEQVVERIDAAQQRLHVKDLHSNELYELGYDKLIIATGAEAVRPALPGLELEGVFTLRTLLDAGRLKRFLAERSPRRALLVGAGYVGLELAETLVARGLSVTVLEKAPQALPGFDLQLAQLAQAELEKHGVTLHTGVGLEAIEAGPGGVLRAHTEAGASHEADLVLVAVGVRPNVALAKAAGVTLGSTGAIAVDDHQRTNLPNVYAAGDCAEAAHLVSKRPAWVPLGPTANKQGKVAGANAAGADERFAGVVGSAAFKLFDLEVARTGLGAAELDKLGFAYLRVESQQVDHARSFSPAHQLSSVLYVARDDARLLGAQMLGQGVVGKRIDVFATAISAGMSVAQVADLDLTYAPPIAPVYDPVLMAAQVAEKEWSKAKAQ